MALIAQRTFSLKTFLYFASFLNGIVFLYFFLPLNSLFLGSLGIGALSLAVFVTDRWAAKKEKKIIATLISFPALFMASLFMMMFFFLGASLLFKKTFLQENERFLYFTFNLCCFFLSLFLRFYKEKSLANLPIS